jgi:hypothetical protein
MAAKKVSLPEDTTLANVIWDKIREVEIEFACLPNQTIEKHVQRIDLVMDKLHLKPKSGMVTPLVELAINNKPFDRENKYSVVQEDQFLVVSLAPRG